MSLIVPLKKEQVEAACRLHQRLLQWKLSDAALLHLQNSAPDFGPEACLLKSVAINSLYSTQVYAIVRMGQHVHQVIGSVASLAELQVTGPRLVDRIASLPMKDGEKKRSFVSFAAKFCHFFIEQEQYPIYDDAARRAIRFHLGNAILRGDNPTYTSFCDALTRFRREAEIAGPSRELDRYLWITGMYMKWCGERHKPEKKQQTNVELRELFRNPTGDIGIELEQLLPMQLYVPRAS